MKIEFPLPKDTKRHRYCLNCHSEKVKDVAIGRKISFKCGNCNNSYERLIDIDPSIKWWVNKKTKEYWHESVGIFVIYKKKVLLFERTVHYPFAFTIPAGHLDADEFPDDAALRELKEETNISLPSANMVAVEGIPDKCGRGADFHKWHLYTAQLKDKVEVNISPKEGDKPVWLSLEDALSLKLTSPVKYFLDKYGQRIINSVF